MPPLTILLIAVLLKTSRHSASIFGNTVLTLYDFKTIIMLKNNLAEGKQ